MVLIRFRQQHFLIKVLSLVPGIVLTAVSDIERLPYTTALLLLYGLLEVRVVVHWLSLLRKLTLFFAVLVAASFLPGIEFQAQLVFCVRIALWLFFSTILTRTTPLRDIAADLKINAVESPFFVFLAAVGVNLRRLRDRFGEGVPDRKHWGSKFGDSLHELYAGSEEALEKGKQDLTAAPSKRTASANIAGVLYAVAAVSLLYWAS